MTTTRAKQIKQNALNIFLKNITDYFVNELNRNKLQSTKP